MSGTINLTVKSFMQTATFISLGFYALLMLGIGVYALRYSTGNLSEFMLGGRRLGPGVTALSAGASDMSGWLMLGVPGAAYASGLSLTWLIVGLIIGAYMNYLLVAPRLRIFTESIGDALTIPDYLEKRLQDSSHVLRVLASVVIVLFFILYTSSGMVAGGKLFDSAFGLPYQTGLWATTAVVLCYTFMGGFMAVSLTDFVQGVIICLALIVVPVVAYFGLVNGVGATQTSFTLLNPDLFSVFSSVTLISVISSMAWGLGYVGQPHIIVRFMAIRSCSDMPKARRIGMSWMIVALLGATSTGLVGALYVAQHNIKVTDPETIFIVLSQTLFHPFVGGFLLAAILAAIMSTISSQLLVSSSSLTEDAYRLFLRRDASQRELVLVGRLCVLLVALIAALLALNPSSSVLGLVSHAWAGFGAAFGPIIILSLHWRGLSKRGALAGMLVGAVTVLLWSYLPVLPALEGNELKRTLDSELYSLLPGFILCWLTAFGVSKLAPPPQPVVDKFNRADGMISN